MTRDEWIVYNGFVDDDMIKIDMCLTFGGKITAIFDKPLKYQDIKITFKNS